MNYEEFTEQYIAKLKEEFSEEAEITKQSITKVNEKVEGIPVKYPDMALTPVIYLKEKFEMYEEGYSMEQIVAESKEQMDKAYANSPKAYFGAIKDFKVENFYCAVINAEKNEELLENVPHQKVADLAVIARYKVDEDTSFMVTNGFCRYLKMTKDEVFEKAFKNLENESFKCENMAYTVKKLLQGDGQPDEYIDELIEMQAKECPIYVLSNDKLIDGAVAIASRKAMEEAYELVKQEHPEMKDMIIIGSSRHELLLIPDTVVENMEDLKQMHKMVQCEEVRNEDRLSENIYRIDEETKQLSIVNTEALSIEESFAEDVTISHARSH